MMTYAQIDKLIALTAFVAALYSMWHFLGFEAMWSQRLAAKRQARDAILAAKAAAKNAEPALHPVFTENREFAVSPLVVHHLSDKATLLMRHRRKKQVCTGHLIVWSGAKRKTIQDSYYDLGIIPGEALTEELIQDFLVIAKEKLEALAVSGARKRRDRKAAAVEPTAAIAAEPVGSVDTVEVQQVPATTVEVEESTPESVRLLRFPSVYRGVIEEIGMMDRSQGDREFRTFGLRYRTVEGIVDAVFGANLREALRDAGANVGDSVEILKIGRKTVESGKAPMNLFKIAKIKADQLVGA